MSYRKKQNPPKPELQGFLPFPKVEYSSPCSICTLSISIQQSRGLELPYRFKR